MDSTSGSQIPSTSHSLLLPSEPPDIRNWFSSYKYESFVLDTYDDVGGSVFNESESERDGCAAAGERNRAKEGNLGECRRNVNSDFEHEEQSVSKMPDSLDSLSLLSEPVHIRNWFPSYAYESPMLDTVEDLEGTVAKDRKCKKDGFAVEESNGESKENLEEYRNYGNSNEAGLREKLGSNGFVKCKSLSRDVCETNTLRKISDSPHLSSFLSEPPDLGNWFSGYAYESPLLGESIGFVDEETENEEDDFIDQDSNKEKEMNLPTGMPGVVIDNKVHIHGFLEFNSFLGDDQQEKQSLKKGSGVVGKESLFASDNLCSKKAKGLEDRTLPNHIISPAKAVEKSSLNEGPVFKLLQKQNLHPEAGFVSLKSDMRYESSDGNHKALETKAQTEFDLESPGTNPKVIQFTGAAMRKSAHGSNDKENSGKEVSGDGFVTTRKNRIRRPNNENSLNTPHMILLGCSRNKGTNSSDGEKDVIVKGKVLSERTNFENSDVIGVAGKWQCPQKNKPNIGPPLKQLRLEQWVRRL